ncbi:hypothetical protein FANTH_9775 [Fusarium anthophilum]|uniref:Uncharacterized protein n=1 Tax=Fusarium anthophilum TaxID=48485 RepID=A0A8H4Z583_9HYPO|nr:hypothetical protein FANTH_9775 [Fusarium anthophilum]
MQQARQRSVAAGLPLEVGFSSGLNHSGYYTLGLYGVPLPFTFLRPSALCRGVPHQLPSCTAAAIEAFLQDVWTDSQRQIADALSDGFTDPTLPLQLPPFPRRSSADKNYEVLQYLVEHKLAIPEELKSCDTSKTDNTVPRVVVYKSIETDEEPGGNAGENDTAEETKDEITLELEDDNREG